MRSPLLVIKHYQLVVWLHFEMKQTAGQRSKDSAASFACDIVPLPFISSPLATPSGVSVGTERQ